MVFYPFNQRRLICRELGRVNSHTASPHDACRARKNCGLWGLALSPHVNTCTTPLQHLGRAIYALYLRPVSMPFHARGGHRLTTAARPDAVPHLHYSTKRLRPPQSAPS